MKRQKLFMSLLAFAFVLSLTSTAMAELALSVIVNPNPVRPGETAHVEFTVTNTGSTTETNVELDAPIPSNLDPFPGGLSTGPGGGGVCPTATCSPGEHITWSIGSMAPGKSVTVTMPPRITGTTADGTEIIFSGTVQRGGIDILLASATTEVKSATGLALLLTEDLDPVAPDKVLTYTLSFGNRSSAALAPGTSLSMPIPTGTTFVSATGDGTVNGDVVEWNLGGLPAGQSGRKKLQVRVGPVDSGVHLLQGEARISDPAPAPPTAQASSITRVESSVPLGLLIRVSPDPARAPGTLNAVYTITNLSNSSIPGVKLNARIPEHVDAFNEALSEGGGGGDCPNIESANLCSPREHMTWQNIGALAIGGSVTLTIPPVITALTPKGTIIPFEAFVEDNTGVRAYAATSVIVADQAKITVNALNTVFGNVEVGTSSEQIVTVTNDGNVNLDIGAIAIVNPVAAPFSIPTVTDKCSNTVLVPAGECTLTVQFTPNAISLFNDSFDIPSNDPDTPSVTVSLKGLGFIPVTNITVTDSVVPVDDHQVAFGELAVGGTSDQTVTVTNNGNVPLDLKTVAFSDFLAAPFRTLNDNCSGTNLLPAGECTLTVRFEPTAVGPFNDTFDIPLNAPGQSLVTVSVIGTGVIGNAAPTLPTLVFPGNGGTVVGPDVSFGWSRSSDSDGDTITYVITACTNTALTNGCVTESNIAALKNKSVNYAGLSLGFGLVIGFVMIGNSKSRKKLGIFMAVLMVSSLLISGCGSGDSDNTSAGGNPAADITKALTGLEAGTTYHWKVTADDGKGGKTDSATRSFTTTQ